jgi:hypothetical protein
MVPGSDMLKETIISFPKYPPETEAEAVGFIVSICCMGNCFVITF